MWWKALACRDNTKPKGWLDLLDWQLRLQLRRQREFGRKKQLPQWLAAGSCRRSVRHGTVRYCGRRVPLCRGRRGWRWRGRADTDTDSCSCSSSSRRRAGFVSGASVTLALREVVKISVVDDSSVQELILGLKRESSLQLVFRQWKQLKYWMSTNKCLKHARTLCS